MPSITDLKNIKKTNKVFKKKEYRPWNSEDDKKVATSISRIIESKDEVIPISKTTKNKVETISNVNFIDIELEKTWRCLYGAKKILLELILKNIEEIHDNYVITSAITTNQLISDSSLPANTIKTSLQQLKHDTLVLNYETKPGKGGFARYKISKNVYEYFIEKFSSSI